MLNTSLSIDDIAPGNTVLLWCTAVYELFTQGRMKFGTVKAIIGSLRRHKLSTFIAGYNKFGGMALL